MMRAIYRTLLWMHPPTFRRQFADEMLWIFDEDRNSRPSLCLDVAVSLVRQWVLRSGWWKIALALTIAFAQVTLGGLGMLILGGMRNHAPDNPAVLSLPAFSTSGGLAHEPLTVGLIMYIAVFLIGGIAVLILGLTFWSKAITTRRRAIALRVH